MISIWDAPPDAFVEPWTPVVGQRVRVKTNPECEWCGFVQRGDYGIRVNGAIGTVVRGDIDLLGHRWQVKFDTPICALLPSGEDYPVHYWDFAASELIPLDEPEL